MVVVLLAGLVAGLPGVSDAVELAAPVDDCSEPCPGDTSEGQCSSSCDECTCCPRTMAAVFVAYVTPGTPRRIESARAGLPAWHPRVPAIDVFHPPRV